MRLNCKQLDSEMIRSEVNSLKIAMYSMPDNAGHIPDAFRRALEEERDAAGGADVIVLE